MNRETQIEIIRLEKQVLSNVQRLKAARENASIGMIPPHKLQEIEVNISMESYKLQQKITRLKDEASPAPKPPNWGTFT